MKKHTLTIHILIIASFIILSFLSDVILIRSHILFHADDMIFNLKRFMDLKDSIIHNNLLPNFSFNRFHGSSVMALYPYLNLYPMVVLSFFIKSKISLVYYFFVFNTFITFIISFYSSKNYTKNLYTSYVFSIIYSLSNVFLSYNFTNMDFGVVYSYIFLPLVIFGFIKLINDNNIGWIELSLGMTLIAYSHILNIFIIGMFLLLWIFINVKNINKNVIINLVKAIILFIIMTSVIWLSIINLYYFNLGNIIPPVKAQLNNINIKIFFSGIYGAKKIGTMGFFSLISIFISAFVYKIISRIDKQMYLLSLFIIIIVLFFPWSITAYKNLNFLNQFQNTYRLLIIPHMLLSFIFSLIISRYVKSINKRFILFMITISLSILLQLVGQYSYINSNKNSLSIDQHLKLNGGFLDLSKLQNDNYIITNSSQFDKLVDAKNDSIFDYIPKPSYYTYHYINNYNGMYNNSHVINFSNIKYNILYFKGNKNINKLSLPIYIYNNEHFNIYLNNKKITSFYNKDGLLSMNNINSIIKRNNYICIKDEFSKYKLIGFIFTIIGWLTSLYIIIKYLYIN